jgi:MFS superfamily sulfate permease-like transporter
MAIAVLGLAPLARYLPKPALAALLLLTAARLIDVKRLAYTLRATRIDAGVVVITTFSAIAFGLNQAILIGVALSILLFVPRAASRTRLDDCDLSKLPLSLKAGLCRLKELLAFIARLKELLAFIA